MLTTHLAANNTASTDNLDAFLEVMPPAIRAALTNHEMLASNLVEVVIDLGRRPMARFSDEVVVNLDTRLITFQDLDYVVSRVGEFGDDNRAGIEKTLHRISAIRNRTGKVIGLTCRVGRAVIGGIRLIEEMVKSEINVLLVGKPGVGKTTMLREVARVLADHAERRVMIVDTSNEIAGDSDTPHLAIGKARRLQVGNTALQHQVMIEAVENHMPEVIVIDEMSTELEALAARTIAERGVQLVATAHGNTLENIVANPSLCSLVGGVHVVTLGDIEARRRQTRKTVQEREHEPTFNAMVEIRNPHNVSVVSNVGSAVDKLLRGMPLQIEVRKLVPDDDTSSAVEVSIETRYPDTRALRTLTIPSQAIMTTSKESGAKTPQPPMRHNGDDEQGELLTYIPKVFAFGLSSPDLEKTARTLGMPINVVKNPHSAEVFVTTKSHYQRRPVFLKDAESGGMPVYVLRRSHPEQIRRFLRQLTSQVNSTQYPEGHYWDGDNTVPPHTSKNPKQFKVHSNAT